MTWSYSGDPSTSDLDEVRFLIGDTNSEDEQLSNEEIAYLLAEYTTPLIAAIAAVENLIALYSRYVDQKTGDISLSYNQRISHYQDLLKALRLKLGSYALPYAGGISIADKDIDNDDSDRVDPAFDVGMMDYD